MGTIADKLSYTYDARVSVQQAIKAKGVNCTDNTPFCDYGALVRRIQSGGDAPSGSGGHTGCQPAIPITSFAALGIPPSYFSNIYSYDAPYPILVNSFEEVV